MLAVACAFQGGFGALLAPATLSLLTTTFTESSDRNRAFGVCGAIAGSGASIGLLLGAALTQVLNWRYSMYVNVVFAIVAVIGGLLLATLATLFFVPTMFTIVHGRLLHESGHAPPNERRSKDHAENRTIP